MGSSWYIVKEDGSQAIDPLGDIKIALSKFVVKLTSRKFLLALSGGVSLYLAGRKTEAAGVVIAYLLGESYIDGKAVV